ncbi:hypothetical protein DAETH_33070 (plasmid) [Deinococcus aetherius]|uniref:NACHT domain-containing protein n=1 Tax=Deinococcus aetherius TaxID=200252 RepID=A0ABM8AHQ2_9DEIO|nr:hypothetical protein [Deinococcus aetherius]BDP43338.1 hypothetical protein DAETH_33070 [Deinococcus aetherius]
MHNDDKRHYLESILEAPFRKDVAVPLLRRVPGVEHVTDVHGRNESGADIIYFERDALHFPTCVGVQLKVGHIDLSTSRKGTTFAEVKNQLDLISRATFHLTAPAGKHKISKFIVMTTGRISERAREELAKLAHEYKLNINFLDGERVIELVDKLWPDFWSHIDKGTADYASSLRTRYTEVEDVVKLGARKSRPIDTLYVRMRLQEMLDERILDLNGEQVSVNPPKVVDEFELLNDPGLTLLIGESGSGKRLILRRLLFEQIERNSHLPNGGLLPFLLDAKVVAGDDADLEVHLRRELTENNGGQLLEGLDERLRDQGAVILVDRLTRVAEPERVRSVLRRMETLYGRYPKVRMIAALRDSETFEVTEFTAFKRWQVQAFEQTQVVSLVSKWYTALEHPEEGHLHAVVEQLVRNVIQGSLPRTPLVYTLNLVLLENNQQTTNLADVLDKYVDLYLGKWDDELNVPSVYDFTLKRSFLSELAFRMLEDGVDRLDRHEVITFFDSLFDRMGRDRGSEEIYSEIKRGGLLVEGNGLVRFVLYAFQEWFAGHHIYRRKDDAFVIERLDERFWGQAIIFYAGLKRACDDLLESVYTLKEVGDFPVQFYRSYLAGMIAVNADESSGDHKREAVRYALYGYLMLLRRLGFIFRRATGQVGELYAGMVVDFMLYYGVGSARLSLQYRELMFDNPTRPVVNAPEVGLTAFNATEVDLPRLFIASLMTRLGVPGYRDAMNVILRSSNPYILMLLYIRLNHMIDLNLQLTPDQDLRELRSLRREVHRKLSRNKEAARKLLAKNKRMAQSAYILPPLEEVMQNPARFLNASEADETVAETD